MKKGKRYQECEKLIDNTKNYNAKNCKYMKFYILNFL